MHHVTPTELDWRTDDPRWADETRETDTASPSALSIAPVYGFAAGAGAIGVAIMAGLTFFG